ncbi:P44/Msp2 family outer membrane protein [Candidatus Neoehrlichia procyonis]|uniref:Surface antigen family protein n=1 Tax=Candidatus Neoehrlichia procyonis str. RAC413 TaxID=1359163 RepID=A0A0F3NNZ3_9RICK|nr:P44/Msp2 family outer membrane protein [Candidatus Neoehrlichia lotoris]KJV69422.1 surface antigen family protein [Candidatus Neoehrlichia lotoris str. RAC413]
MLCKRFLARVILIGVTGFSLCAFFAAYAVDRIPANNLGFYIGAQYKPGISYSIGGFTLKGTLMDIVSIMGLKPNAITFPNNIDKESIFEALKIKNNFQGAYSPSYKNSFTGFSGLIGYSAKNGTRLEVEYFYENFELQNPSNYTLDDSYKYFAVVMQHNDNTTGNYYVMQNSDISIASMIVNTCYDFIITRAMLHPYICVGVGGGILEAFNLPHIKFIYQTKAGLSYSLTRRIVVFANGYYSGITNNKLKNLHFYSPIINSNQLTSNDNQPANGSATAVIAFNNFLGAEIGIRFIFNWEDPLL